MSEMSIHNILKYLPHRYPFVLVDRVLQIEPGKRVVAQKNVTYNEPFFTGHFPEYPVMPGVMILEALAQACGILIFKTENKPPSNTSLYYLAGIDNARFKQVVEPGDQLILEAELDRARQEIWKFNTVAKVDGNVVCSATLITARKENSRD